MKLIILFSFLILLATSCNNNSTDKNPEYFYKIGAILSMVLPDSAAYESEIDIIIEHSGKNDSWEFFEIAYGGAIGDINYRFYYKTNNSDTTENFASLYDTITSKISTNNIFKVTAYGYNDTLIDSVIVY